MIAGWSFTALGLVIGVISIVAYLTGHHRCRYCHESVWLHVVTGVILIGFGVAMVVTS